MRKAFMCSFCHKGILGGGLYLDPQSVTYVCQKLTIEEKYKKIVLSLNEVKEMTWKWIIFPVAIFHMKNGDKYSFIIFNKWRFDKYYKQFYRGGHYEKNK